MTINQENGEEAMMTSERNQKINKEEAVIKTEIKIKEAVSRIEIRMKNIEKTLKNLEEMKNQEGIERKLINISTKMKKVTKRREKQKFGKWMKR